MLLHCRYLDTAAYRPVAAQARPICLPIPCCSIRTVRCNMQVSCWANDVDFCLRLHAHGYDNAWTPHAQAYHHESASRGIEDDPVKQARFAGEVATMQSRWQQVLGDDPAYSPCLSLEAPAFSLDPDRHALVLARDSHPVYHVKYKFLLNLGTLPES